MEAEVVYLFHIALRGQSEGLALGGKLAVKRQAKLLDLSRSSVYYTPRPLSDRDLALMRRLDELHLEAPFYGARKLTAALISVATRYVA
jgi:hypothetical protein